MDLLNWRWLPNAITLTRCGLALLVGWLILQLGGGSVLEVDPADTAEIQLDYPQYWSSLWPLLVFILTALSDFLDGYLARKLNAESEFGAFWDPIADKLLVAASLLALCHLYQWKLFLLIPTLIILTRDALVTAMRLIPNVNLPVSRLAKYKTAAEMLAISLLLFALAWVELYPWVHNTVFESGLLSIFSLHHVGLHSLGLVILSLAAGLAGWTGWVYLTRFWNSK